jgi:lysophospholipase L1-like esterase
MSRAGESRHAARWVRSRHGAITAGDAGAPPRNRRFLVAVPGPTRWDPRTKPPRMKTPRVFRTFSVLMAILAAGPALHSADTPAAAASASDAFWPADGNFPVPGKTSSWVGFRAKNVERRTLFAQRKALDRNAVVFVGDSILEGWHTAVEDLPGIGAKLANRGVGGDTTPNLVYRLQEDVLSLNPKALVVMIGTNDLSEHTTPEQIASNCRELLTRTRAACPNIPIAWCLVMPRRGEDNYPELIRDLNRRIVEMAKSDPLVTICDTYTPLALPDGSSKPECFLSDRLHPNAAGFAAMKQALHPILLSWKLSGK